MPAPRILIVDDSREIASAIALALTEDGYVVDLAYDGVEALSCADRRRPDLILVDLMMPVMDGRELVGRIRKKFTKRIPIIVLTAAVDITAATSGMDVEQGVAKPFDLNDLISAIGKHVPPPGKFPPPGSNDAS